MRFPPTDRISHIEIMKGPGSSLYGSTAMSGVINIITKSAEAPLELRVEAKGGSKDLANVAVNLATKRDRSSFYFNGSSLHEGLNPRRDFITLIGNDQQDFGVKWQYRSLDDRIVPEVTGSYTHTYERSRDDLYRYNTAIDRMDIRPQLRFRYRPWAAIHIKTRWSQYDRDYDLYFRRSNYHDLDKSNVTRESVGAGELDYWRQFTANYEAIFGIQYQHSGYKANRVSWGAPKKEIGWSAFAQSESRWTEEWTTIAGLRFDRDDQFGDFVSPKLSAMYEPDHRLKIRGSIGRGYRSPSWVERYLTLNNAAVGYEAYGNPDLKPETSIGYNLGYEILFQRKLLWTVNGFYNTFRDQILDNPIRPGILSYENIGSSYTRGFESSWKWYLSSYVSTSAGYQYVEAYDLDTEVILPHPRHTGNIRFDFRNSKDNLSGSLRTRMASRFVRRYIPGTGEYEKDPFTVRDKPIVDLTVSASGSLISPLWSNLRLTAGGTNLQDYVNEEYGPFTGRRLFVSLAYSLTKLARG